MKDSLKDALTRATLTVRSGDPMGATRIIRQALGAGTATSEAPPARPPGGMARAPLGAVVGALAKHRCTAAAAAPRPEPACPSGAEFLRGTHEGAHGRRNYRLYVPADAPGRGSRALVVMLHGCTQTPENFAAGTRMNGHGEAHGALVLWPEQPQGANNMRCWNWFEPGHQTAESGEPAILADMVGAIARRHGIDRARIYAAGLSAGGAMAALLAETHPELFAAVGIHSGLPAHAARGLPEALALMRQGPTRGSCNGRARTRRIVFHGDADTTVHPGNGAALAAAIGGGHETRGTTRGRAWTRRTGPGGEYWQLHGGAHAWSGGHASGSHTDPSGPDASAEMLRFFLEDSRQGQ